MPLTIFSRRGRVLLRGLKLSWTFVNMETFKPKIDFLWVIDHRPFFVFNFFVQNLCVSIIKIYNACIIIHSANCDVVIPEEEQLSSMPCREFVIFRGSAVNIHLLFKLWLSNFFKVRLIVAYTMSGYYSWSFVCHAITLWHALRFWPQSSARF